MANWFSIQFREEQDHARMLMDHVLARGGKVALAPIAEVPSAWDSPLAAFEDTLKHEKSVTARIDALCELAAAEKDFASANRLVWFVDEQIEEEENVQGIIDALKLVGDDKVGTFMLDKELGARTSTPAPGNNSGVSSIQVYKICRLCDGIFLFEADVVLGFIPFCFCFTSS